MISGNFDFSQISLRQCNPPLSISLKRIWSRIVFDFDTPPLSALAGTLTGRAETLPVGFRVTRRPSGEILLGISPPMEKRPARKGFLWDILCLRWWVPVDTRMPSEGTENLYNLLRCKLAFPVDFGWNSALPVRIQGATGKQRGDVLIDEITYIQYIFYVEAT